MQNRVAIKRILIANRGEIARRIIRTARRLGIETVAVFTDPDRDAPYVHEATTAVALGAADRYLDAEGLVAAALNCNADAIHPGYGFLSESAHFARLTRQAGVVFIGPPAEAIEKLGSKTRAKGLALAAQVPTSPTLLFTAQDLPGQIAEVAAFGASVGFPLLIKAAAGGGGRGMRILTAASDVGSELESAMREAQKAFGDGEVFVERFLSPARHIEVQVAADQYGAAVALGSRDCSLQRNNQKIIEEAPAPSLIAGIEQQLFQCATELAKGAGYSSLGTVEFLYLADGTFYFLEVNTRLQVEHPVTEAVTGLDLVEVQVRLAEGHSLAELGIATPPVAHGHAVEARFCAEEYRDGRFINATGTVASLELPDSLPATDQKLRCDMGVVSGSQVSYHYDSMLGKVIVHAPSRAQAIAGLEYALKCTSLSGVATNRALLIHLLRHQLFLSSSHTIQGSKELFPAQETFIELEVSAHTVFAALRVMTPLSAWAADSPWLTASPHYPKISTPLVTTSSSGNTVASHASRSGAGRVQVSISNAAGLVAHNVVIEQFSAVNGRYKATVAIDDGQPMVVSAVDDRCGWLWVHLPCGSVSLQARAESASPAVRGSDSVTTVSAHLPGKVVSVAVSVGDQVSAGEVIATLDSMKMEHPLKAPRSGRLKALHVVAGSVVQAGALIAELIVLE
jgi:acetyl/propionyl-CoA carboxylase alpha subunit